MGSERDAWRIVTHVVAALATSTAPRHPSTTWSRCEGSVVSTRRGTSATVTVTLSGETLQGVAIAAASACCSLSPKVWLEQPSSVTLPVTMTEPRDEDGAASSARVMRPDESLEKQTICARA